MIFQKNKSLHIHVIIEIEAYIVACDNLHVKILIDYVCLLAKLGDLLFEECCHPKSYQKVSSSLNFPMPNTFKKYARYAC